MGSRVGGGVAIAIDADGLPVVSHESSESGGSLRVTKCASRSCQ